MKSDAAQAIALRALARIASDETELERLLVQSGLAPRSLRARASDPTFLGFVLDFVMGDEARARTLAEAEGLRPEDLTRARAALPGGDAPYWT